MVCIFAKEREKATKSIARTKINLSTTIRQTGAYGRGLRRERVEEGNTHKKKFAIKNVASRESDPGDSFILATVRACPRRLGALQCFVVKHADGKRLWGISTRGVSRIDLAIYSTSSGWQKVTLPVFRDSASLYLTFA